MLNVTFEDVKNNNDIKTYIQMADETLIERGITEHSFAHVTKVSLEAGRILAELNYDEDTIEMAKIAGYLHDIGNVINRIDHAQSGAVMAFRILDNMGAGVKEIATVITAIGNHDESTAFPVNAVSAALIIADKSDVRYTRVRNTSNLTTDIHDRVNFAVKESFLEFSQDKKEIWLKLTIDKKVCKVIEYFEIFMSRMLLCSKAAQRLGVEFKLDINGQQML